VKDYKVYAQNSGGTARKHNYESANQTAKADARDELRKYIAGIAQAAVTQEEQAANIRDSNKAATNAMFAQIKVMTDQIAQRTKAMANKENRPNSGGNGGSSSKNSGSGSGSGSGGGGGGGGLQDRERGRAQVQYTKPRNMGCYCSSHGFHPAGKNRTSATCNRKHANHDAMAMWNDRKGGSVYWPPPICVSIKQQSHPTYAGKSAPTN
jgi:hypothetical protein